MPKFLASIGFETPVKEVALDPTSALSEAYRSARTALQFSTEEGVPKCLLVTSARPNEGKSTAALCLAINFGQLGQRVLVIDAEQGALSLFTVESLPFTPPWRSHASIKIFHFHSQGGARRG